MRYTEACNLHECRQDLGLSSTPPSFLSPMHRNLKESKCLWRYAADKGCIFFEHHEFLAPYPGVF